ncbi:MAG: N-acetyl-gamma-glutamyl-phosphate reductase [Saccharofermentanales bacterium]
MSEKIRIGIIGATGYVGMELVRILCNHPSFQLTRLVSQSYAGKKFSEVYPAFSGIVDIICSDLDTDDLAASCDFVITSLPHGVSSAVVPQLLGKGLRVLDHSGDFRYRDISVYEKAYKLHHPDPALSENAVYGLPELYREKISDASLVANPGCYPTCSILAIHPLIMNSLIDPSSLIIDATSGITGAGRKTGLEYQFCEAQSNYRAYGVTGHRHTSEIEQELSIMAGEKLSVTFTPHLAPISRGMYATIYATLSKPVSAEEIHVIYNDFYKDEFFVRVMPSGICPEIKNVAFSNFIDISVFIDEHTNRAVVLSAIDNLGKGAAQQAIQSLNCMAGIPENTGLMQVGGGL